MRSWTVHQMMMQKPCYTREEVEKLWKGNAELTLKEILDLPIYPEHKIWVAIRSLTEVEICKFVKAVEKRRKLKYDPRESISTFLVRATLESSDEEWLIEKGKQVSDIRRIMK